MSTSEQTRRNAMALTAAFLRRDDDLGAQLASLGLLEVLYVTTHLLHAMATVMEEEHGSRDAAIDSLNRQIAEMETVAR